MSEQLKPCPFCGGEARLDRDSSGWNKIKAKHSDNCPLHGNNLLTWSSGDDVPMVVKWNTRALTPKQECANEMREILLQIQTLGGLGVSMHRRIDKVLSELRESL